MKKRRTDAGDCGPHDRRGLRGGSVVTDEAFSRAAALFRAAGDEHRLRVIEQLGRGEHCVSELAEAVGAKMSTLSQQLRLLRSERIVTHRREGKHVLYTLADDHVHDLITAALDHASEATRTHPSKTVSRRKEPS